MEATLVKALRTHAAAFLEVRMLMSSPTRAEWYGQHTAAKNVGGYEIRLKETEETLERVVNASKGSWDEKTLYVVCNSGL